MLHLHDRHQAKLAVDLVTDELGDASLESALAVAQYNSSAGRQSRVEVTLEEALDSSRPIWNGTTPVYGWILLADWAELSGRSTRADSLVVKALEIAELMQARRPFVAEDQRGVRLVESRIGRLGSHDDFARSIIDAAAFLAPPSQPRSPDAAYFTPKEREILRELPRHQSVGEIAAKQQLSPNTIKTHMRSIYQKLGVSGRADAVEQAEATACSSCGEFVARRWRDLGAKLARIRRGLMMLRRRTVALKHQPQSLETDVHPIRDSNRMRAL